MRESRTTREALIAELLGDIAGLLERVERLPETIAAAETRLALTAQLLEHAGDKYRLAVTAFTEEAKVALTEHVQHKASQSVTHSVAEQLAVLQAAIRAGAEDTRQHAAPATSCAHDSASHSCPDRRWRLIECTLTAVLTAVITAAVCLFSVQP